MTEKSHATARVDLELGIKAHSAGDIESAVIHYERALVRDPACSLALGWLGTIEAQKKNFSEALMLLEKATLLDPNPDFLANYGGALLEVERYADALNAFQSTLKHTRDQVLLSNLAVCYNQLKDPYQGLLCSDEAISIAPCYYPAWHNRGNSLRALGRIEEALSSYSRALELDPSQPESWCNVGIILSDLNRHDEAIRKYRRCLEIQPDYVKALNNLGVSLNETGNFSEAESCYAKALEIDPNYSEAWCNRGVLFNEVQCYQEALNCYQRAIEIRPDYHEAWCNRGVSLNELGKWVDALACYDHAITLNPDYAEAHYNKGLLQLEQKDFQSGFRNYRWRKRLRASTVNSRQGSLLDRDSEPSRDGRLFLLGEQGIGDEVFYCSLLPQALSVYPVISLAIDGRLHPVLRRSFSSITLFDKATIIPDSVSESLPARAALADLPFILAVNENELSRTRKPFFSPPPERTSFFKAHLKTLGSKKICGLSWKSNATHVGNAKSISPSDLEPLFNKHLFAFANLQYGSNEMEIEEIRKRSGGELFPSADLDLTNDIEGLLALIEACDFVVTTSNVTAHLAGSLGKCGCVLVPYSRGRIWYWHRNDIQSFWYPTLKVFYQDDPLNWKSTIRRMTEWLEEVYR